MKDQVIVITGATGNVGWGIAQAALDSGARIVLPARSAGSAEKTGLEFPEDAEDQRTLVVTADPGEEDGAAAVRDAALERFGRIDHVYTPLGAFWRKPGDTIAQDPGELDRLLRIFVRAQFVLARTFAPALRDGRGSLTMISGAAGEDLIPGTGLLVAAVNAQYALARVLCAEHARDEFRFNELRIAVRIEREGRAGVVPARDAGAAFLEIARGDRRSEVIRYDGGALE